MAARRRKESHPFPKVLKSIMEERSLTVAEIARMAGVPRTVAGDWTSGSSPADYVKCKRLADALGVSLAFLLTGENDVASGQRSPTIAEVFADAGDVFDGYCQVTIRRLVPRAEAKKIRGED